jgi:2-C-methyl-D-erythritol 4-phosphate cytidylyltransferase
VKNGLAAMANEVPDDAWVLVHDAARPCLEPLQLASLVHDVKETDCGGILAMPVADTLKLAEAGSDFISKTVSRTDMWQAQTPQMFRRAQLEKALQNHPDATDEAGAMEAMGMRPRLIMSTASNFKVTYPADLQMTDLILKNRKTT